MRGFLQKSVQKHSTISLQATRCPLPTSAAVRTPSRLKPHCQAKLKLAAICAMSSATPAQQSTVTPDAQDSSSQSKPASHDPIVQYVVLRKDLWGPELKWPLGSIVAQACHASSAAMWLHREDDVTVAYCSPENLDSMHKVRTSK